jgi:hypothetical protein
MRLLNKLRWAIVRFIEPQIQSLITRRILAFRARLIEDGLMPDLMVSRSGRLAVDETAPANHPDNPTAPAGRISAE